MKHDGGFPGFVRFSVNKIFRLTLILVVFNWISVDCLADFPAKKRRPPGRKKNKGVDREIQMVNGDLFIGLGVNFASGDYLEYQKSYYNTSNPRFLYNGEFTTTSTQMNFGGQVRVNPFKDFTNHLSMLGFVVGGSFLQRSFSHKFGLFNDGLPYEDQTTITEDFHSSHFLGQFMIRYGYRLYGEVGITTNMFLAGYRKQDLNRYTTGDNVFGGGFEVNSSNNFNLTTDVMASGNVGWCFGVGFQFHRFVGARLMGYYNTGYFKEEPDLTHFQPSFQVLISY
jgi:hypothetical protein